MAVGLLPRYQGRPRVMSTTPERDRRPDSTPRRPPPAAGPAVPARSTDDQPKEKTPIVCYGCGQLGHVDRECPSSTSRRRAKRAQFQWEDLINTYIDVCGTHHRCLLDTGCEKSLIPASLVPSAEVKPVDFKLYAANNTPIVNCHSRVLAPGFHGPGHTLVLRSSCF